MSMNRRRLDQGHRKYFDIIGKPMFTESEGIWRFFDGTSRHTLVTATQRAIELLAATPPLETGDSVAKFLKMTDGVKGGRETAGINRPTRSRRFNN